MNEIESIEIFWEKVIEGGVDLGKRLLAAMVIYLVGHYLVKLLNYLLHRMLNKRAIDPEVRTFATSAVSISLNVLLIVAIIGALGIETASFTALIASLGVTVGMAMSGQMQNVAGGLILLLQRPYRIGDYIITNDVQGTVIGIQLFSTKLNTPDNQEVTVPNGSIVSNVLTNRNVLKTRRIDFTYGVEYNSDIDKVRSVLQSVIDADPDVLREPEPPMIVVENLAESSVNIKVRVWVPSERYWDVTFRMNENVYKKFNEEGISFPFPQLTVHQG